MAARTATATQARRRAPLNRGRVLATALGLVDAEGIGALSMRRLGNELGVEAMSLYKHVPNKDALLDGIVEHLWSEVADAVPDDTDWTVRLRSLAHAVRAVMHRHPQAAPLLLSRCVLPPQLLETYAGLLDTLRDAGFDDATAAQSVRSLCSYALGYASTELYCFGAWRTDPAQPSAQQASGTTMDVLLWLGRTLPASTPPRLIQAAMAMCDCDPDRDFRAGVDLAIQGLRQLHAETARSERPEAGGPGAP